MVIIEDSLLSMHDVMGLADPTGIVYEICEGGYDISPAVECSITWIIVAGIGITLTRQHEFIKY